MTLPSLQVQLSPASPHTLTPPFSCAPFSLSTPLQNVAARAMLAKEIGKADADRAYEIVTKIR